MAKREGSSNGTTTDEVPQNGHEPEVKDLGYKEVDGRINPSEDYESDEDGDGQVMNDIAGESIEDDGPEFSHVWYACYGSNMYSKRFMCYIQGGQIEGMSRACHGCRDATPPEDSDWRTIPNRLFFGHKFTRMWGHGGVAFIDPVPELDVHTHVRIYKITSEQFNDVMNQENPGIVAKTWKMSMLLNLLKREPHHKLELLKGAWYGNLLLLGEKDGLPILTFTCSESHMESFRSGEVALQTPSASYRNVIVRGLADEHGLPEQEAHDYVSSSILPK
jgi:histone deacetylase 6